jgi:hypothetical protein
MIGVGYIEKQDEFRRRHQLFFDRFPNLVTAIDAAFDRTLTAASVPLDPLIFYLGMRAVDDFQAIVVLAANDMALSAQSLLRGMYERIVTAAHLHDNPDDAVDFAEFDYVQRRKLANAVRTTFGYSPEDPATLAEFEREYERVKARYEVACDDCGKRRMGPGWSKLDFVTQAKRQQRLADYVAHAYYLPLLQAHSTLRSASALLEVRDGTHEFRRDFRQLSDEVFRLAYVLLLNCLQTQVDHFGLPNLDKALRTAVADHLDIYPAESEGEEVEGAETPLS